MKQDEAFRKKPAKKLRGAYETDERMGAVNTQGLAACGMIAILYVIVRIIYVGFHGGLALPELVLLFLMGIAIRKVNRQHKVHKLPTVFGKVVDPSPKARGKLYTEWGGSGSDLVFDGPVRRYHRAGYLCAAVCNCFYDDAGYFLSDGSRNQ